MPPPCRCGHRYDHHIDPADPRATTLLVGCWLCRCTRYHPAHLPLLP